MSDLPLKTSDLSLNLSSRLFDYRLALYCLPIPLVAPLLRIATAVHALITVEKRNKVAAEKPELKGVSYQERWHSALDVAKWAVVSFITMELFVSIGPVIAIATLMLFAIAIGLTIAEQGLIWLSGDRVTKLA